MERSPSRGPSAGDTASAEEPAPWAPPGQAGLPGWAGAACRPGCRELPGAGQREPCCRPSPTARLPLQPPRSLAGQRARAAPSASCGSRLLPRKRGHRAVEVKRQASAPRPSQRCPPAAKSKGEAWLWNKAPRGPALSCRRATGTAMACGKGSSSPGAARGPACQRRREGPSCPRLLPTHQLRGHLGCRRGRVVAAAGDRPARNTLCSRSSPAAERAPGPSGIGPWPRGRGGNGRGCAPSHPHLCVSLDQPLQAAGA